MTVRIRVFAEDAAHEAAGRALLERLGALENVDVAITVAISRGGAGRALTELRGFVRVAQGGALQDELPDIGVVLIDANRVGRSERRAEIEEIVDEVFPRTVIGTPDPHIERWLFDDVEALSRVLGTPVPPVSSSSTRARYKERLQTLVARADVPITQDPAVEFAPEVMEMLRLTVVERADPSLRAFIRDARSCLRRAREGR